MPVNPPAGLFKGILVFRKTNDLFTDLLQVRRPENTNLMSCHGHGVKAFQQSFPPAHPGFVRNTYPHIHCSIMPMSFEEARRLFGIHIPTSIVLNCSSVKQQVPGLPIPFHIPFKPSLKACPGSSIVLSQRQGQQSALRLQQHNFLPAHVLSVCVQSHA